jgi:hypothetical protein
MSKLSAALVAFQTECPSVSFDKTNPAFKSRYASLAAILKTITPVLSKHGLAIVQFPVSADGKVGCVTRIIHESGESMEETLLLPLAKNDPQGAGSAITYARRYGLSGALGIVADDDDDGEAAMGRAAAVMKPMQQPAARPPKAASPMSNANKTKLAYASRERIKELGDDSITVVEIIREVAKQLGYGGEVELTDADFGDALSKVQTFDPGGEG